MVGYDKKMEKNMSDILAIEWYAEEIIEACRTSCRTAPYTEQLRKYDSYTASAFEELLKYIDERPWCMVIESVIDFKKKSQKASDNHPNSILYPAYIFAADTIIEFLSASYVDEEE